MTDPTDKLPDMRCQYRRFHELEYVVRPDKANVVVDHPIFRTVTCRHCGKTLKDDQIDFVMRALQLGVQHVQMEEIHLIYRPPTQEELVRASR